MPYTVCTGRAQREDAATIVAPDEQSKLDAIERFVEQQIPQRKLERLIIFMSQLFALQKMPSQSVPA